MQVGTLSKFLDQWRNITSSRFVLNMMMGHNLQFRYYLPLFYNFRWFNIMAALVHHPIIQKYVDELSAKGDIEPSTGGNGLYSSVFVVSMPTGGLQHILNLNLITICTYLLLRYLLGHRYGNLLPEQLCFFY